MRLLDRNGALRPFTVLEDEHVSQPGTGGGAEHSPSRYAAQRSVALPSASSVLLLKLFPNEGPTSPRTRLRPATSRRPPPPSPNSSPPGKSPATPVGSARRSSPSGTPASMKRSRQIWTTLRRCFPPVTAALSPASFCPLFCALIAVLPLARGPEQSNRLADPFFKSGHEHSPCWS